MHSPIISCRNVAAFLVLTGLAAAGQGVCGFHDIDTGHVTGDLNQTKLRVAVDADLLVVAAPWLPGTQVTVRERDPATGGWRIAATIPDPAPASGSGFGEALSLDGTRLAVAHPADSSVWIYDLQAPSTPALLDVVAVDLPPASFLVNQTFSCVLSGDLLLAPAEASPTVPSAHIASFERQPGTSNWIPSGDVSPPSTTVASPEWGWALDSDGEYLVAGDPLADGGLGSAHVFRRDGSGAWSSLLNVTGTNSNDGLGNRVAIEPDAAVVGNRAWFDRRVEVLRRSPITGDWSHEQTLLPPVSMPMINGDTFGQELELDRGTLIATTPQFHVGSMQSFPEGLTSVFVIDSLTDTFVHEQNYAPTVGTVPPDGEFWGYALAFDGEQAALSRLVPDFVDIELHVDVFLPRTSDCNGDGTPDACEFLMGTERDVNRNGVIDSCEETGVRYCDPGPVTSTGEVCRISAFGVPRVSPFYLDLRVAGLAAGASGYVIASQGTGVVPGAGGALGSLCVDGAPIARAIGGVRAAGPDGSFRVDYNRGLVPLPTGPQPILSGDTWNFQAWFRDAGSASAFTDAISVTFL